MEKINLQHGAGGKISNKLVKDFLLEILGDVYCGQLEDSTELDLGAGGMVAFTTDSFVVDPIFFSNGDIGKIAVCGTVNDLAVSGAIPMYLSLSLILEEGFPLESLKKIMISIRDASLEAGIKIATGDTKVVKRGQADKIYINTTGIGQFIHGVPKKTSNILADDAVIVSGLIGNHGISILSTREGLGYENIVSSDCAPLNGMIRSILDRFGDKLHFMRDLTRGGLGSILNEIADSMKLKIMLDEIQLPIQHEVKMASDMLGISPLYLANEGNIVIFAEQEIVKELLKQLHSHRFGTNAQHIGDVTEKGQKGLVELRTRDGGSKQIDYLEDAELPRLC